MKILILGALPNNQEEEKLYNTIISVSKEFASEVSSPLDTARFKGTDKERYKRAVEKVKEADFIIGEQTLPSTGQGIEIGVAGTLNKPLIVISGSGAKVSGLIKGCPILKELIEYNNFEDLNHKLSSALKKHNL